MQCRKLNDEKCRNTNNNLHTLLENSVIMSKQQRDMRLRGVDLLVTELQKHKKRMLNEIIPIVNTNALTTPLNKNLVGHIVKFRDPYKARTCIGKVVKYMDGRHILSPCNLFNDKTLTPYKGWRRLQDYHDNPAIELMIFDKASDTFIHSNSLEERFLGDHRQRRSTSAVDDHIVIEARRSTP